MEKEFQNRDSADNKSMVIESLASGVSTNEQIIDMLLLLLNDWELRSAIMKCQSSRDTAAMHEDGQTVTVTKNTTINNSEPEGPRGEKNDR